MTPLAVLVLAIWAVIAPAWALDPPMDSSNGIDCLDCHTPHSADGDTLTRVDGNPNLCMSCHTATGIASAKPFTDAVQAYPGTVGTSHRFDSGPSGHAEPGTSNTSTGTVTSGGTFSGRIERIYTVTLTAGGNVGTATYAWTDTAGNSGVGVTGTNKALADGITVTFANGTSPSFAGGDKFYVYVRTDLRLPSEAVSSEKQLALRLENGAKVVCSTCHNQHSQEKTPADTSAPSYTGTGSGAGRHYQRETNSTNEMCLICHSARNVSSSSQGSHPIGVSVGAGVPSTWFQAPSGLQTIGGKVYCTTCHSPHYTSSGGANGGLGDGYLLDASIGSLCYECHTLGDATNASHLKTSTGLLWPGGQYGSSFPAHSAGYRGYCVNCHWPHGWPDDSDTTVDYPKLWVEQYDASETGRTDPDDAEDLCFTCHDGSPATSNVRADIIKGTNATDIYHHPVKDSEQSSGRTVECISCHNPHRATSTDRHAYVAGVDITGATISAGSRTLQQYELCFKCHGDTYNSSRSMTSNKRTDFGTDNSAYHPVVQAGRNLSSNLSAQLVGGLTTSSTIRCTDCHNSDNFSATTGPVTDSSAVTVGPHGSSYAPILRANLNRNYTSSGGPSSYSSSNFTLCFRCHSETALVSRRTSEGARTNFYDDINGKENLHWVHLNDRISKSRAVCVNCHFDIHSNQSSSNTQYRIDGTLYASAADVSAARKKTHMVNFSPDVTAYTDDGTSRSKPEWYLNTSTRERRCYVTCHSYKMGGSSGSGGRKAQYRVSSGDETVWTY